MLGGVFGAGEPGLRDLTERVVIASKGRLDRARPVAQRADEGLPSEATAPVEEFMEATTDIWEIRLLRRRALVILRRSRWSCRSV